MHCEKILQEVQRRKELEMYTDYIQGRTQRLFGHSGFYWQSDKKIIWA